MEQSNRTPLMDTLSPFQKWIHVQSGAVVRVKETTETAVSFVCLPDPRFKGPLQTLPLKEFQQTFAWINPETVRGSLQVLNSDPTGMNLTDEEILLQTQRARTENRFPVRRGQVWEERKPENSTRYAVLKGTDRLGDGNQVLAVVLDKGTTSSFQGGEVVCLLKTAFLQACHMVGRVPSGMALPEIPAYENESLPIYHKDSEGWYLSLTPGTLGVTVEVGQVWRNMGDCFGDGCLVGDDKARLAQRPNYKVLAVADGFVTVGAQTSIETYSEPTAMPPIPYQDFRMHFYYLGESLDTGVVATDNSLEAKMDSQNYI